MNQKSCRGDSHEVSPSGVDRLRMRPFSRGRTITQANNSGYNRNYMTTPEQRARKNIDDLLTACGWTVQSRDQVNLGAGRGVAVREFPMKGRGDPAPTGFADYALFVDRRIIGAVEAKAEGTPLSGVEPQTDKYSVGLPAIPPAWHSPLPFLYESTGIETFFTNVLDPDPRSRRVFAFHRPETLAETILTMASFSTKAGGLRRRACSAKRCLPCWMN